MTFRFRDSSLVIHPLRQKEQFFRTFVHPLSRATPVTYLDLCTVPLPAVKGSSPFVIKTSTPSQPRSTDGQDRHIMKINSISSGEKA